MATAYFSGLSVDKRFAKSNVVRHHPLNRHDGKTVDRWNIIVHRACITNGKLYQKRADLFLLWHRLGGAEDSSPGNIDIR